MDDAEYVGQVMAVLTRTPTAQHLDYLVEAFARIGRLAADAETLAERAEHHRKHMEAVAFLNAKRQVPRPTADEAKAIAMTESVGEYHAEAEAKANARMLRNLLEAIEQAINAIKFLGRMAG